MGYRDPIQQTVLSRAKSRALAQLIEAHRDEYNRFYENEMRKEGFARVKRGPHHRGGKGNLVWVRLEETPVELKTDVQEAIRKFIADSDERGTKPRSRLGEAVRLLRSSLEENERVTPRG